MTTRIKAALLVVALGVAFLAGCSKQPEPYQSQQQAPTPNMMPDPEKPATSKDQLAYYSQHLDEARQTWHECQAKGVTTLTDQERSQCIAAQAAWESQPYKGRKQQ